MIIIVSLSTVNADGHYNFMSNRQRALQSWLLPLHYSSFA